MEKNDVGEDLVKRKTLKFVPINFNSVTSILGEERTESGRRCATIAVDLVFARIIHSMFVCDVPFEEFLPSLLNYYGYTLRPLKKQLYDLKAKYFPTFALIALVDEISKVQKNFHYKKGLLDTVRHEISTYCDLKQDYGAFFSCAVFSSLNMKLLEDASIVYSSSGYPFVELGRLRMFDREETKSLLQQYMEKYNIFLFYENDALVSDLDFSKIQERMAFILHDITGGHPRSLDLFFDQFESLVIRRRKKSIVKLLNDAITRVLLPVNPACVRAAVISKPVKFQAVIPYSSPEITFDNAIEEGLLIGSNMLADEYVPFMSEIMLLKYTREDISSKSWEREYETKQLLCQIMDFRFDFKPVSLEYISSLRERLLSIYRVDDGTHGSVSVSDIFSNGIRSDNFQSPMHTRRSEFRAKIDDVFGMEVNRNEELQIISFKSGQYTSSDGSCGIFVPESLQNEGFDYVIRYPIVRDPNANDQGRSQDFLEAFYQIKYSVDAASTKLNNSSIETCYRACEQAARYPGRFVFVMFGWREKCVNVQCNSLPPNTVLYDKDLVLLELGPTFSSFVDTLETSKIYFGPKSDREE